MKEWEICLLHVEYIGFDEFYTAISSRKGYWTADTYEDRDKY